jgi:hypothetical protein
MSSITQNLREMSATAKTFVPQTNMNKKQQEAKWAFDTNCRNENGIVVCIPRVFSNITKERVFACMINTGWGRIEKVDLVKGNGFNKAFVHFEPNNFNEHHHYPKQALDRMMKGEQVVFVYERNERHPDGWFWKIGISTSVRPKFQVKRRPMVPNHKRKKTLDLSGKNTTVIVPQKVVDAQLLLRKNDNQKVAAGDDPIQARIQSSWNYQ